MSKNVENAPARDGIIQTTELRSFGSQFCLI